MADIPNFFDSIVIETPPQTWNQWLKKNVEDYLSPFQGRQYKSLNMITENGKELVEELPQIRKTNSVIKISSYFFTLGLLPLAAIITKLAINQFSQYRIYNFEYAKNISNIKLTKQERYEIEEKLEKLITDIQESDEIQFDTSKYIIKAYPKNELRIQENKITSHCLDILQARKICNDKALTHIYIPAAIPYSIEINDRTYHIMIEEKPKEIKEEERQQDLYMAEPRKFDKSIKELTIFALATGFMIDWRHMRIMEKSKEIAVINLERTAIDPLSILFEKNKTGFTKGLISCVDEEGMKIIKQTTQVINLAEEEKERIEQICQLRKSELKSIESQRCFYHTNNIETGAEPVIFNIDTLVFSNSAKEQKIQSFIAKAILHEINHQIAKKQDAKTIHERRYIWTHDLMKIMNQVIKNNPSIFGDFKDVLYDIEKNPKELVNHVKPVLDKLLQLQLISKIKYLSPDGSMFGIQA